MCGPPFNPDNNNCVHVCSHRDSVSHAQALFSTFVKSDSLAPAAVAGAVSLALFTASRLGRLPAALVPLMRNLLGWTATLLFMFQPLAQLVRAGYGWPALEG